MNENLIDVKITVVMKMKIHEKIVEIRSQLLVNNFFCYSD